MSLIKNIDVLDDCALLVTQTYSAQHKRLPDKFAQRIMHLK